MHAFGMREDEATVRMASVLPNYSPLGTCDKRGPFMVVAEIVT